jgi:hypothetical protein
MGHHPHLDPGHNEDFIPPGLKLTGLGIALALTGPVGAIIAAGAGSVAGAAWLIARARERSVDTSHLSNLVAVEPGADRLTDDQMLGLDRFLSEHPFLLELNERAANRQDPDWPFKVFPDD